MNERTKTLGAKTVAPGFFCALGAMALSASTPVAAQPPAISTRAALQARLSNNVDFPARVVEPADFFEPLAHALQMPIVFPMEISDGDKNAAKDAMSIKRPISAGMALKTLIAPSYGVAVVGGVMTSLSLEKLTAFSEPLRDEATNLAGLKFINSLSDAQVKAMYAKGSLETPQLSSEQAQILIEFLEIAGLHKWGGVAKQFPAEVWPPTPEQWRASPLKFDLAYTLSFTFLLPNNQETANVALWDLGRGWVRELPTTAIEKKQAALPIAPLWRSVAQVTPKLSARAVAEAPSLTLPSLTVEKTRLWSAAELGAEMQRLSGRAQPWSARETFKKTQFLLTDGTYSLQSLERIVALYAGDSENARADKLAGDFKESDELFFVGETAARVKQERRDRVNAVAAQSKAKLQRLPSLAGIFREDAFEKRQKMPFVEMTPLQQALIRDSATNSGWVDMMKLEIEKSRVVLFESITFHIYNSNGSSGYQIW